MNNRVEHSDQDQSEKKYKQSLPSKQPHEWLKWQPLLEPLEPNKTDEVSYRNKSEIKEATNAQLNDLDELKLIGMLSALNHQIPSSLPVLEQKQIIASGQT